MNSISLCSVNGTLIAKLDTASYNYITQNVPGRFINGRYEITANRRWKIEGLLNIEIFLWSGMYLTL
jgi:hypothetical protein